MGKEVEIVPSILSADFAVLAEEIKKVKAGATRLVAGQAVFGNGRIEENIKKLRRAILEKKYFKL